MWGRGWRSAIDGISRSLGMTWPYRGFLFERLDFCILRRHLGAWPVLLITVDIGLGYIHVCAKSREDILGHSSRILHILQISQYFCCQFRSMCWCSRVSS